MAWTESIPRPQKTWAEWLTATPVAPVAARWRGVALLEKYFPALFRQPVQRIYQLSYLDAQHQAAFSAEFLAGKLSSICWLGKLQAADDDLGYTVLSELTSVYLLRLADSRWALGLLQTRLGAAVVLPVPRGRLLLLLLLSRKLLIR